MVTLNLILIAFAIFFLAEKSQAGKTIVTDKIECEKGISEIDELVKLCIHIAEAEVDPRNDSFVDAYCRPLKALPRVIRRHVPCEDKFRGQLLRILSTSMKKPIQFICKDHRAVAMRHYKCFSEEFLETIHTWQSKYIDILEEIQVEPSVETSLLKFCCSSNWFLHELGQIKGSCNNTSEHAGRYLRNRVESAVNEILDLICSPYRTFKVCKEKVPEYIESIETREPQNVDLSRNIVKILLTVLGRLASQ